MEGALHVFCFFSQIPNTKLSLLNCQDCIIAGKVQCFSSTHVHLNDTGFGGISSYIRDSKFRFLITKANEILHHKDKLCTQCIYNGSSLGFFQALLFPALGSQEGEGIAGWFYSLVLFKISTENSVLSRWNFV